MNIELLLAIAFIGIGVWCVRKYMRGTHCPSFSMMTGKTIIITGANGGIGKETARELARRGGHVILACRDVHKGREARDEIRYTTKNVKVEVMKLDLASLESVRGFTDEFLKKHDKLHILINNAGVMMVPYSKTQDGFEMHFGVNHLGHFLLTNLLLDKLIQNQPSRIINVSSLLHSMGTPSFDKLITVDNYNSLQAYSKSKLANVLFTRALSNRLQDTKVTVYAVHPGVVDTNLLMHMKLMNNWISRILMYPLKKIFEKSAVEGAQTSIYCAVAEEISDQSGLYYSDCSIKKPSEFALDENLAEQLWNLSEKYVQQFKFPTK